MDIVYFYITVYRTLILWKCRTYLFRLSLCLKKNKRASQNPLGEDCITMAPPTVGCPFPSSKFGLITPKLSKTDNTTHH